MREDELETIVNIAKRNFKVLANIGVTTRYTKRFATVFDTRVGSIFIRIGELLYQKREKVKPLDKDFNVRNAIEKCVSMIGGINLVVNI